MTIDAAALRLPDGVELVRTTQEFDETGVPAALLAAHRVADGVWGRLVVRSGEVGFTFEADPAGRRVVSEGEHRVIPPSELHRVDVVGPVRFAVEFHREPRSRA